MAGSTTHHLSPADARRVAVRAQLLTRPRPTDLLEVVRHLGVVQHDPTAAVVPSAHLVLWSRLGSAYSRDNLDDALADGSLLELHGFVRPADDLALLRADMAAWPDHLGAKPYHRSVADWFADNEACRRDILEVLRQDGPLPARDLPDTCVRPWRSSGWNDRKNVGRMLEVMVATGQVAAAGRDGRDRLWDLAERVYPDDEAVPAEEAARTRDRRRLAALGIARARAAETPGEPDHVGEAGEDAVVEGVRGRWRVDPTYLTPWSDDEARTVLLSPLDRLVMDRRRMAELLGFDYQLEMYKPAAKRRWGYWALPVLHGDRLVGKVDATADREAGVLRVDAVHEDEPFDPELEDGVRRELTDLATWLDLEVDLPRR